MARSRQPASVLVPVGLQVSEADAARIDEVLTRPEYAGWTRAEWCREIIRSALRYYTPDPVPDPGQPRGTVRPAAEEPAPPASEVPLAGPESPARAPCPHPADARDYQTGTCAACGAILWD